MPAANRRSLVGVGLVILSGCCFGTLAIFGKTAYRLGLSTPQLLSYRFAGAAVLFWVVIAITRQPVLPRSSLGGLVLMGAVGYAGQSAAYFTALHFISASATALLLYTYPVVVTLLAAALFAESINWSKLVAVGFAFAGTLLVVQAQLRGAAPIGIILALMSAATYSGYILVGSRLLPGVPPLSATATIMTGAGGVWTAITAASGQLLVSWTPSRLGLTAGFIVLGTAIPVLTFILGLRMIGASRAAILSTFEPASTVVLAVLILGESASPLQYVGGGLILASVIVLEGRGWLPARVLAQVARD